MNVILKSSVLGAIGFCCGAVSVLVSVLYGEGVSKILLGAHFHPILTAILSMILGGIISGYSLCAGRKMMVMFCISFVISGFTILLSSVAPQANGTVPWVIGFLPAGFVGFLFADLDIRSIVVGSLGFALSGFIGNFIYNLMWKSTRPRPLYFDFGVLVAYTLCGAIAGAIFGWSKEKKNKQGSLP